MWLSSLNRLSAPRDQRESAGIGAERYREMEVLEAELAKSFDKKQFVT